MNSDSFGTSANQAKKGSLANIHRRPVRKGDGLDWDAIREAREARLREEAAAGGNRLEHRALLDPQIEEDLLRAKHGIGRPARGPSVIKSEAGERKPSIDVDRLVILYVDEGMTPQAISELMHVGYPTVIKWLKKRKVFEPNKFRGKPSVQGPGPPMRDTCRRGHDLSVPGNTRQKYDDRGRKNGRECIPCQRANSLDWKGRNS